jgi:DNA-binding transcriptional MerR regulator
MKRKSKIDGLRVQDAAIILDVHEQTVRVWERSGLITCVRDSAGHRRFALKELLRVKKLRHEAQRRGQGLSELLLKTHAAGWPRRRSR